jgi:hypothetical protein
MRVHSTASLYVFIVAYGEALDQAQATALTYMNNVKAA